MNSLKTPYVAVMVTLIVLGGCAAPTQTQAPALPASQTSQLPKGIKWTDGHAPVHISGAGAAQCLQTTPQEAQQALSQTNALRQAAGLPALQYNAKLQAAAMRQACNMASMGVMTHAGKTTTGPAQRVKAEGYKPLLTAENIAAGSPSLFSLSGTLAQWAASPGHRANVLLPTVQDYGVGQALSQDGKVVYWSAVYAQHR